MKICIAGGGGFIGHHLSRRLKKEGHYVVVADIRREYMKDSDCDEFLGLDLRKFDDCLRATEGCEWVFNLAADMGGMGYIQSNNSTILYNSTMISYNMIEAARRNGAKRFFYASSACVYPENIQDQPDVQALREDMAWPAHPQDAYGFEKISSEQIALHYAKDFDMETRIARFHNIYGPEGTWCGGREKAPAAFCRKVIAASDPGEVEIWGDGLQTRSFCYVDDCVEGILRIMKSDYTEPLNLGTEDMVSMNQFMQVIARIENKDLTFNHIKGPEGVRGRNSDNTLIRQVLGWAPSISLEEGITKTYYWIKEQMSEFNDTSEFQKSVVVAQSNNLDHWVEESLTSQV